MHATWALLKTQNKTQKKPENFSKIKEKKKICVPPPRRSGVSEPNPQCGTRSFAHCQSSRPAGKATSTAAHLPLPLRRVLEHQMLLLGREAGVALHHPQGGRAARHLQRVLHRHHVLDPWRRWTTRRNPYRKAVLHRSWKQPYHVIFDENVRTTRINPQLYLSVSTHTFIKYHTHTNAIHVYNRITYA